MKAKLEIASDANGDIFVNIEVPKDVNKLRYWLNWYKRSNEPPYAAVLEFTYYETKDDVRIFRLTGFPDEMARGGRMEFIG